MKALIKDFISLLFPDLCRSCFSHLNKTEISLCLYCRCNLPKTDFHDVSNNKTEKLLWGRVTFQAATSFLYFSKKGITQRLIHQLKYKNQPELGVELGRTFGRELQMSCRFEGIDMIVPIPLHNARLKERGYNQSEKIAEGVSEILLIPCITGNLIRIQNRKSQTGKSRLKRWDGIQNDFKIIDDSVFESKRILLIDDVITTGSTIEASCRQLDKIKDVSLLIATIGIPIN